MAPPYGYKEDASHRRVLTEAPTGQYRTEMKKFFMAAA